MRLQFLGKFPIFVPMKNRTGTFHYFSLTAGILLSIASVNWAKQNEVSTDTLTDFRQVHCQSVYNRGHAPGSMPAAIIILDEETIQQSGAIRLQDILNTVPGFWFEDATFLMPVHALRNSASVSNNTVLFFLDGMLMNNSMTAGVYFPLLNIPLANIERIEILKGNWGAYFGTNGVTGVVHVFTKNATTQPGLHIQTKAMTLNTFSTYARYARQLFQGMHVGAYFLFETTGGYPKNPTFDGLYVNLPTDIYSMPVDSNIANLFPANDVDGRLTYQFGLQFQGTFIRNLVTNARFRFQFIRSKSYTSSIFTPDSLPFVTNTNGLDVAFQDNSIYTFNDYHFARAQLQLGYTGYRMAWSGGLNISHMTFNLELSDHLNVPFNDLTFGLYLRSVATATTTSNIRDLNFDPAATTDLQYAAYVQDRVHDSRRFELLLGLRAEVWTMMSYKPYLMPSARLAFYPSPSATIWGAFAWAPAAPGFWETHLEYRHHGIPYINADRARFIADQRGLNGESRDRFLEQQAYYRSLFLPGTNELYIATVPDPSLKSPGWLTYEYGFRKAMNKLVQLDIAGYFAIMKNGIAKKPLTEEQQTVLSSIFPTETIWPIYYSNFFSSYIWGGEFSGQLQPRPFLKMHISYSIFTDNRTDDNPLKASEQHESARSATPTHILRFTPQFEIPEWSLSLSGNILWASEYDRGTPFNFISQKAEPQNNAATYPASTRFRFDFYLEKTFFQKKLRLYLFGRDVFSHHQLRYYSDNAPIGFPHTVDRAFGGGLNFRYQFIKHNKK